MSEYLVVRLPARASMMADAEQETAAEWIITDGTGSPRERVQRGPLQLASTAALGRRVLVLVPGTDALLAEPVLPLKGGAKLAQVVPFALEEQLASDVEDLHFAVGKRESRPGTPVTVVSHARMQAWQASLAEAGIHADAIYAESAALPVTPNGVTLLVDQARVYVRRETTPGAVLEVEPLIEALQLGLASGDESREHVTIYVSENDYERERDLLEGLREFTASLQLKLMPEGALPIMAATVIQSSAVNLLQGRYAVKRRINVSFAPWRFAAVLAGVFFAAHLGLKGWQWYHYKQMEARLDDQITEVFQQAMPGAPVPEPLEARKQVELRLNQLRGTAPVSGMMTTLALLSEALAQAPGTNLEALSFRNNITDLRLLAPSVDALESIRQVALEKGVTAEIQSARPRESKFEGLLQLKGSGA
ncbi:MAG TPA: type II secretion system protein GspL [Steroidobacteraceae bacterium]|jgi:general secretion pathway protein L|nr:type II secretion system protein GspL [Steroidobacteraceae bacterium]